MADAYYLKRRDVFLGKELKHGESGTNTFIRLAKRNAGEWKRPVHEIWDVAGETGELKTPIDHQAADSLTEFVSKLNDYTTRNAKYLKKQGVKASAWDILAYPIGKFIQNYILKRGFLDGQHGFVHAVLMSFHSFSTRSKLYLLWRKKPAS
ncbi:MAG: hypothetical protein NUV98_06765 [Candidatus Roizmanbacteria bacterium]|nr:hypothetical protein [Candidatus Roizmanbacteria bacterium]